MTPAQCCMVDRLFSKGRQSVKISGVMMSECFMPSKGAPQCSKKVLVCTMFLQMILC